MKAFYSDDLIRAYALLGELGTISLVSFVTGFRKSGRWIDRVGKRGGQEVPRVVTGGPQHKEGDRGPGVLQKGGRGAVKGQDLE